MSDWVLVRSGRLHESLMAEAALLRSAGLTVWTPDQPGVFAFPFLLDMGLSGGRLYALRDQAEQANAMLAEAEAAGERAPVHPCPGCGARTRRARWRVFGLVSAFFIVQFGAPAPLPFLRRKRVCPDCRTRFTPAPPEPWATTERA